MANNKQPYSAGILPYTIVNNEILYLLGRDWRDTGWSDFGGKCEEIDKSDPRNTAIREFYEESMGSIVPLHKLNNYKSTLGEPIKSVTLNGSPYYMYYMYVVYDDYQMYFDKIYQFIQFTNGKDSKYLEKCEIKWISSKDMKQCLQHMKLRNIFKKTIHRCKPAIDKIENVILKNALKE